MLASHHECHCPHATRPGLAKQHAPAPHARTQVAKAHGLRTITKVAAQPVAGTSTGAQAGGGTWEVGLNRGVLSHLERVRS